MGGFLNFGVNTAKIFIRKFAPNRREWDQNSVKGSLLLINLDLS